MRGPNGDDHWTRGHYTEIEPGQRLVIDMDVLEGGGVLVRANDYDDAGSRERGSNFLLDAIGKSLLQ